MKKIKKSWFIALILFIGFQTNALATSCWVTMFPTPSCEGPMTLEGSDQTECEVFMGGTWYSDSDDCTAGVGLSSATPANGDKHVALDQNIVLVFVENVVAGSGTIELKNSSDDSTVESFDITDTNDATISGATLTLLKSTTLVKENTYYLTIPSTAIVSSSDNTKTFPGYSDSSGLAFSTNYKPTLMDLSDLQLNLNGATHSIDLNPLMDKDSDTFTVTATSNNSNIANLTINKFQQIGTDIDGEAADDWSGDSVALSNDGSIVAIGADFNDGNGDDSGHVRVYENNNGTWTQIGADIDGEASGDRSGISVAISGDGSIVAIGAYNNGGTASQAGHVRVYQNISGTWTQIGTDIDGEAGVDHSGNSVALSNDGSIVAIGAHWNDGTANGSGHVRVYQNISGTWTQIGTDIDGEALGDHSGESVAISGDGSIVAIGASENREVAYGAGHVRVYQNISGTWTQIGSDIDGKASNDNSGKSVSLSNDGSIVAIGAPGGNGSPGYVRVYQNISGTWIKIGADIDIKEAPDMILAYVSVSISSDGSMVAIGQHDNSDSSGNVRVYKNINGTWTQIVNDIDDEAANDKSGYSVSLSGDGSTVAIGAPDNDGNGGDSGHVRVYSVVNNLNITPKTDAEGIATVTLSANDGYDTVSKSFTLTVGDPNNTPTDITLSSTSITENSTTDTVIGSLSTTDIDAGDSFTYSFCGGSDDTSFSISGSDLKTNGVFDYETQSSYSICIRTTDSGNATFDENFNINVININDNSPIVTSTTVTSVDENSAYSYTLKGSDVDRDSLTWSVKNGTTLPSWLSLTSAGMVSTLAGTGSSGSDDGVGTSASFNMPLAVATDSDGNIYVADTNNQLIRKIDSSGNVTTIAGSGIDGSDDGNGTSASFSGPIGIAVDNSGNVYIADLNNNKIRKIDSSGNVTTLATLSSSPMGVIVDRDGNVYALMSSANQIVKIDTSGNVTTYAGSGTQGSTDANGTSASFKHPTGLAIDNDQNIYVADTGNHLIRKIDSSGDVTTIAGSGSAGSTNANGTSASFNYPSGIAVDSGGNIYIGDGNLYFAITYNVATSSPYIFSNHLIRKIDTNGDVTTFAGTGTTGSDDGDATSASFYYPSGLAIDNDGNLFVPDTLNNLIRKISTTTSLSGTPSNSDVGDHNISLVVSDGTNETEHNFTITVNSLAPTVTSTAVTSIDPTNGYNYTLTGSDAQGGNLTWSVKTGTSLPSWLNLNVSTTNTSVSTLAGTGNSGFTDGVGTSAQFNFPQGIAVDSSGNRYVADRYNHKIRKIDTNGIVTTLAGTGNTGSDDGAGTSATFNQPTAIAVDSNGNIYITDTNKIRKIDTNGIVTTLAGTGSTGSDDGAGTSATFNQPTAIAVDSSGNVYVADTNNNTIRKIDTNGVVSTFAGSGASGFADGAGTSAQFNFPSGIAIDSNDNIYVADTNNNTIRKIDSSGNVTTLAGTGSAGSDNGVGTSASFNTPNGVTVDSSGNIYVADTNNNTIRKIDSSGNVTTLAGIGSAGSDNGVGTSASFNYPTGVAVDSSGNIYIADQDNHQVRKLVVENSYILSGTPTNNDAGDYTISLIVSDGTNETEYNFTITVNNTNNTPTDITLSSNTIAENSVSDTVIGSLSTTDVDVGDSFTYSFCGGTDDANFSINGSNLKSNGVFDYETQSSYSICIRTTDSENETFDENFTIIITDISEGGGSSGNNGGNTDNGSTDSGTTDGNTDDGSNDSGTTDGNTDDGSTDSGTTNGTTDDTLETPLVITDEGNFDEDPTDGDMDILIIKDDGTEDLKTLNTLNTGQNISTVSQNGNNFNISFIGDDGTTTTQTITVEQAGATQTNTANGGVEISSSTTQGENTITNKVELNSNGTSAVTFVSQNADTTKKAAIVTLNTDTSTKTNTDGSVEVDLDTTTNSTKASIDQNGSTIHAISIKDNNGEVIATTEATSNIDGSVVAILEDGSVQTKVTQTNEDNSSSMIVIDGKTDGSSLNILKLTDSNGDEIITKTDATIPGTKSVVNSDGSVSIDTPKVTSSLGNEIETSTSINSDGSLSLQGTKTLLDGTVEPVELGSFPKGAEVTIQNNNGAVIVEITTSLGTQTFELRRALINPLQ